MEIEVVELGELVKDFLSLSNTELVFISDFSSQKKVMKLFQFNKKYWSKSSSKNHVSKSKILQIDLSTLLHHEGLIYQSYEVESLKAIQDTRPPEHCPYFIEPLEPELGYEDSNPKVVSNDEIYTRTPLIPLGRFYPTYLIWVDDTSDILSIFDKTVLKCEQKIDAGIYNRQSKFLFVANQNEKNLVKVFGKNEYLTQHRYVAVIQSLPYGIDQKFKVFGNNLANQDESEKLIFNHLWSTTNRFKVIEDVFSSVSDLQGKALVKYEIS